MRNFPHLKADLTTGNMHTPRPPILKKGAGRTSRPFQGSTRRVAIRRAAALPAHCRPSPARDLDLRHDRWPTCARWSGVIARTCPRCTSLRPTSPAVHRDPSDQKYLHGLTARHRTWPSGHSPSDHTAPCAVVIERPSRSLSRSCRRSSRRRRRGGSPRRPEGRPWRAQTRRWT